MDASEIRDLAVEIVDFVYGYTVEYSHDAEGHAAEYDWVEDRLQKVEGQR